jgi:hypothetical protein
VLTVRVELRCADLLTNIIAALDRVVVSEAMNDEAVRRFRVASYFGL